MATIINRHYRVIVSSDVDVNGPMLSDVRNALRTLERIGVMVDVTDITEKSK